MHISVEPEAGPALDRLITALLNATGACHQVVNGTTARPGADGVEIIGAIATRLRRALSCLAEHNSDEELELATRVLAETTLLIVEELGLRGRFRDSRDTL